MSILSVNQVDVLMLCAEGRAWHHVDEPWRKLSTRLEQAGRRKTLYSLSRRGEIVSANEPRLTAKGRSTVETIRQLLGEDKPEIVMPR